MHYSFRLVNIRDGAFEDGRWSQRLGESQLYKLFESNIRESTEKRKVLEEATPRMITKTSSTSYWRKRALINASHEGGVHHAYVDITKLTSRRRAMKSVSSIMYSTWKSTEKPEQRVMLSPRCSLRWPKEDNHHGGIMIDGEWLTHLLFADNCAFFAINAQDSQDDLQQWANVSKEIGLGMNPSKITWMRKSSCTEGVIRVDEPEQMKFIYIRIISWAVNL